MEKSQLENLIVVIHANEARLMVGASCQRTSRLRSINPFDVHVCLFVINKDNCLFNSGKILALCVYMLLD